MTSEPVMILHIELPDGTHELHCDPTSARILAGVLIRKGMGGSEEVTTSHGVWRVVVASPWKNEK